MNLNIPNNVVVCTRATKTTKEGNLYIRNKTSKNFATLSDKILEIVYDGEDVKYSIILDENKIQAVY